jgi:hypothetical protein
MQMADALEGGRRAAANARHALIAFVRNAYPKYTDFLETKIDIECDQPEAELKSAVAILSRKAESDGRLLDGTKPKASASQQAAKDKNKNSKRAQAPRSKTTKKSDGAKKRAAEANATVVERKKKPNHSNTSSSKPTITCWDCGGTGHTQAFHRKFLNRKVEDTTKPDASAQL